MGVVDRRATRAADVEVAMPEVQPSEDRDLVSAVEHAHQAALAVLDDPQASSLGAVAWLSVHLAAVDQVLYRKAERVLPEGAVRVARQRRADHRLVQALWRLDRRLTGDVHQGAVPVARLEREVRDLLATHTEGEHDVLRALSATLDGGEVQALVADLQRSALRGPTRPHPDLPHGRRTSWAVCWVEGVVDRARDLMDSRPVPTPTRPPVLRRVTRWGAYGTAGSWRRQEPGER